MTRIVSVGADLFADALESQAAEVDRVTWRPPMEGTATDLATVATDPLRADANARALAAVLGVQAMLVDVRPASDALGLQPGQFLHAGPPIGWDRMSGPLRGALTGAALLEGWARDAGEAAELLASGEVRFDPCHHHSTVGPMAGVVAPSIPVISFWALCVRSCAPPPSVVRLSQLPSAS